MSCQEKPIQRYFRVHGCHNFNSKLQVFTHANAAEIDFEGDPSYSLENPIDLSYLGAGDNEDNESDGTSEEGEYDVILMDREGDGGSEDGEESIGDGKISNVGNDNECSK